MKKLILLSAVMALALLPLSWAGDNKANDKPACCAASKDAEKAKDSAACCQTSKAECAKCPMQGGSCPATAKNPKNSAKAVKQQAKADKKAAQAEQKALKKAPQQN